MLWSLRILESLDEWGDGVQSHCFRISIFFPGSLNWLRFRIFGEVYQLLIFGFSICFNCLALWILLAFVLGVPIALTGDNLFSIALHSNCLVFSILYLLYQRSTYFSRWCHFHWSWCLLSFLPWWCNCFSGILDLWSLGRFLLFLLSFTNVHFF